MLPESVTADSQCTPPCPAAAAGKPGCENEGAPNEGALNECTPKPGPGPLNTSRLAHGLRTSPETNAKRISLGKLPASMRRVEGAVLAFRRLLETEVLAVHGEIGFLHAALVESACRHHRHGALCLRWLRLHEQDMSHTERLAYSKAIADSGTARDRCIERLGLVRTLQDEYRKYLQSFTEAV